MCCLLQLRKEKTMGLLRSLFCRPRAFKLYDLFMSISTTFGGVHPRLCHLCRALRLVPIPSWVKAKYWQRPASPSQSTPLSDLTHYLPLSPSANIAPCWSLNKPNTPKALQSQSSARPAPSAWDSLSPDVPTNGPSSSHTHSCLPAYSFSYYHFSYYLFAQLIKCPSPLKEDKLH